MKESAAWALGYIARHNAELAQMVVDAGAVALLVLCVQEPELNLKSIAASALSDIAKHGPELAQAVVDAGKGRGRALGEREWSECSVRMQLPAYLRMCPSTGSCKKGAVTWVG